MKSTEVLAKENELRLELLNRMNDNIDKTSYLLFLSKVYSYLSDCPIIIKEPNDN